MSYTIHIPSPYQARHHVLLTQHTTNVPSIDISTSSAVSGSIYSDAKEWGWNVEYTPINIYTKGKWETYRRMAKKNGWYEDLWYIWQTEHGVRIRAKDNLLHPQNPSVMRTACRELCSSASRIKRARVYAIGLTNERPGVLRRTIEKLSLLGGVQDITPGRKSLTLRRTASEGDLKGKSFESVMSLPGSLAERLGGLELDRRASALDTAEGGEKAGNGKSASESPFSAKHVIPKVWYE